MTEYEIAKRLAASVADAVRGGEDLQYLLRADWREHRLAAIYFRSYGILPDTTLHPNKKERKLLGLSHTQYILIEDNSMRPLT
jgi:hypothetical protein